MEALERASRHFGVECAGTNLVLSKKVEKRTRNRRLADTAFVCAY